MPLRIVYARGALRRGSQNRYRARPTTRQTTNANTPADRDSMLFGGENVTSLRA